MTTPTNLDALDKLDALHAAATPDRWLDSETGPFFRAYPALAAEIRQLRQELPTRDAAIKMAGLYRGECEALQARLARVEMDERRWCDAAEALRARVEELEGALSSLQAILCCPEGTPCFAGSDGDRRVAVDAFAALARVNTTNGEKP